MRLIRSTQQEAKKRKNINQYRTINRKGDYNNDKQDENIRNISRWSCSNHDHVKCDIDSHIAHADNIEETTDAADNKKADITEAIDEEALKLSAEYQANRILRSAVSSTLPMTLRKMKVSLPEKQCRNAKATFRTEQVVSYQHATCL
ncbi:MAG: hypothetical protein K6E91_14540 [Butyrivibrio sp.]|nr:hypothetical protein [Butyrivibrio sp.]